MNTVDFLKKIWPSEGVFLLAVKTDKGFRHKGFESAEDAAEWAGHADTAGVDVYHACAAYRQRPYVDANGHRVSRTRENWLSAKAFWCDVDCGAEKAESGAGYATKEDARIAVDRWCIEHQFPAPMVVSSGHGLHCYWVLTDSLPPDEWVKFASAIKASMRSEGVRVDPTRSADFASILRPVGTHNRKSDPVLVEVLRDEPAVDTAVFLAAAANLVASGVSAPPAYLVGEKVEELPFPEAEYSARLVADKCPLMAKLRDTQGDVSYETWRGLIGVIHFCKEGLPLAREWSARRAETGHAQTDVDLRFNSWNAGPTTCDMLADSDKSFCEMCPYRSKIKTPLVLGREMPEPKAETVEAHTEDDARETALQVDIPELPQGYEWNNGQMIHWVKDKDGNLQPKAFCRHRFYLVGRIRNHENAYEYVVRVHLPHNAIRTFKLSGEIIGQGGAKLFGALGAREILVSNNPDAGTHMCAYLRDQVRKIMDEKTVMPTYSSFGWQDDGSFLLGNRLYKEDGSIAEALLSGYALDRKDDLPMPRGSLEEYAKALNWVYNRPGMEPMQYVICAMFASPMVKLFDMSYSGIPIAITGAASGKGKTTACLAALSGFGDASRLTVAGEAGATPKARSALLGTMSDIPVLFDEVTNMTANALSSLAYALSNGMEPLRLRATSGAVRFADRETWHLHAACTGNSYIGARLAQNGQSEAEAMRIFELRVDKYDIPQLNPIEVTQKLAAMNRNAGCAGEALIRWLVSHKDEFTQAAKEVQGVVVEDETLITNAKYRFFRNHVILSLTAAAIMKNLGIIEFDLRKLTEFALQAVKDLCEMAKLANAVDYDSALTEMIDSMQMDILVTPMYRLPRNSPPYDFRPKTALVGRAIKSPKPTEEFNNKLYLSSKAIRQWCVEHRVDQTAFKDYLKNKGVFTGTTMFRLGTSTKLISSPQRCWEIDLGKIDIDLSNIGESNE